VAGYGRTDEEWEELVRAGLEFLKERAKLGRLTSYTELNVILEGRTGLARFDFEEAGERAAVGHLLGLIVERDYPTSGLMISALVQYLDANDAGPGFYVLARQLGLLAAGSSKQAQWDFWWQQVKALHERYQGPPPLNLT
jgi:hypothetical protein